MKEDEEEACSVAAEESISKKAVGEGADMFGPP